MLGMKSKASLVVGLAAVFALFGTAVPASAAQPLSVCQTTGRSSTTYVEVAKVVSGNTCSSVQAKMTRTYLGNPVSYLGPQVNWGYSVVNPTSPVGSFVSNSVRGNFSSVWSAWANVAAGTSW